jgi:hypothetical protein
MSCALSIWAGCESDLLTDSRSGGPQADSKGNVIGLGVSGMMLVGVVPSGLNSFIPINDALTDLNIDLYR